MKVKRITALFVLLIMLCLVFSSCNGNNSNLDLSSSNSENSLLDSSALSGSVDSSADDSEKIFASIDFTDLLFGKSYDIGFNVSELDIEVDIDGVLEFSGTNMNVVGLGRGQLKISTKKGDKLYEGTFVVYNSILATEIRQQLIAMGIIHKMGETITASQLLNITEIKLDRVLLNDVSVIQGVKYLPNLEILSLKGNNISDISFLSGLKNLVDVDLSNNRLTDISPLSDSKNLLKLNVSDNNLTNISPIVNFGILESINISNNNITDIKALSTLFDLKEIYLNNNNIDNDNIDAISGLDQVVKLGVGYCSVEPATIYGLRYIKNLQYLDMSGLNVDLTLLPKTNAMKELILKDCSLSSESLKLLSEFKNLEALDISKNGFDLISITTYINNLDENNKITHLGIGENRMVSLPDLSKLRNLKVLDLKNSYNLIDISNLLTNIKIEDIYLDACNSISFESGDKSFSAIMNSLENLKKLSLVNGLYYINRDNYNYLVDRINNNENFAFRLFEDEWVNKNTLSNYSKAVYFSMQEFLSDCKSEKDGKLYNVVNNQRKVILNLINDNNSEKLTIKIPQELFEINIYARENETYYHSFNVLEREQSEFTFNLYNYNTKGNNDNIINAKFGSKLIINNFGKSSLSFFGSGTHNIAVSCYDLFINSFSESSSLIILGGKGYNGSNGASNNTDWNSRHGGWGGTGFAAIKCHNVKIKGYGIKINGGDGGNGGNGGNATGGRGPSDYGENGQNGGYGGNGGTGGNGIDYSGTIEYDETVEIIAGNGGSGGYGGKGGKWGENKYAGHGGSWGGKGKPTNKISE